MEKELNVKRLDVVFVEPKLNTILGLDKNDNSSSPAFLTMLTLTKPSNKHHLPANAPFPAIVKRSNGDLAVFCCNTGKHEIIPEGSYKEPTPAGKTFEYKGHVYEKNPVYPIYSLKK